MIQHNLNVINVVLMVLILTTLYGWRRCRNTCVHHESFEQPSQQTISQYKPPSWCDPYVKKSKTELPKCIQTKASSIQQSMEEEKLYTLFNRTYLNSETVLRKMAHLIKTPPIKAVQTISRPYENYLLYENIAEYFVRMVSISNQTPYTLFYHKLLAPMTILIPDLAHISNYRWYECHPNSETRECPFQDETYCKQFWFLCDKGATSVKSKDIAYTCPSDPTCYFSDPSSTECKEFESLCRQTYVSLTFAVYILQEFSELGFVVHVRALYDLKKGNLLVQSISIPNTFKACDTYVAEASNQRNRSILAANRAVSIDMASVFTIE